MFIPSCRTLLGTLMLIALLPATTNSAAAVAGERATPPRVSEVPELKGLAERWQGAMQEMKVPGLAIAIVKDGQVLAVDGFGQRNPSGDPVTPETMFYIASMTKPYTAMGLCILADEGKVDLDAPVKEYLPDFQLADAQATQAMTVRDLLSHRPGLNDSAIVFLDAYSGQITDDVYYRRLREVSPAKEPAYSNVHFTLAGRVIEAVSGQKWQDFLEDRIFDPAGMDRTTAYASVMYGDDNNALPMILLDGEMKLSPLQKSDRTMHAAGGMGTTAEDAARWLMLNINKGEIDGKRIVSAEMARQMQSMQARLAESEGEIRVIDGYGLGWQIGSYKNRYGPMLAHGGGYVGAASYMAILPQQGIGVSVMANTSETGAALCAMVMIDVFDRLLEADEPTDLLPDYARRAREELPNAPRTPAGPPLGAQQLSQPLAAYTGRYRSDTWGTVEFAEAEGGHLLARLGDLTVHLYPPEARPATQSPPRPRLGVTLEPADGGEGIRIVEVIPASLAEKLGLKADDVVTHLDGEALNDPQALVEAAQGAKPEQVLKLTILREGESRVVEARLPAPANEPPDQPVADEGPDVFYGWMAPGMDTPGRFILEGDKVVAVELEMRTGQPTRFERVAGGE